MKYFSWKAEEKTAPHLYKIQGWLPNRYLQCVMFDSIPIYKPNMKGGHTHNHIYNKCHKHIFRSKQARKNVDRKDKPEFVRIMYMNIELGNYSFDKLLHTIFHHNKKTNH